MKQSPFKLLLRALSRFDIGIVTSLGIIGGFTLIAIFAYIISPDYTKNANQVNLSIASKKSGFEIPIVQVPIGKYPVESKWKTLFFGQKDIFETYAIKHYKFINEYLEMKLYPSGLIKKIALNRFSNQNPNKIEQSYIRNRVFLLGTDSYGRDILSRLLIGTRVSLSIGLISVLISLIVGLFMGTLAGYFGGAIDRIIMWIINVTWSIPTLLLVMAVTLALGKGFWQVFIAVGLTMWVEVARIVRGQLISIKNYEYIKAAKVLGYSQWHIIRRHMLPNTFGVLSVILATNFASAILIESGLSFLGIGTQPPIPTWGGMIKQQYAAIIVGRPLSALVPGGCIVLLVIALMTLAEKLQQRNSKG